MAFNDTIGQLTGNSTFYDWYTKENSEIIAKLNQLGVSGVTGADGILSSTNTTTASFNWAAQTNGATSLLVQNSFAAKQVVRPMRSRLH